METLVPGSHTRICVDSAPVRERFLAERAGVGKCTRSGMLYVPGAGTRVFLAEILWTHPVPEILRPILEDPCADCQLCQRACPGAAIRGDGSVDARKCLSYLTIEHKAELPDGLRLPGRIYGCDVCTGVCPLNAQPSPALPEFRLSPRLKEIDAETLENMGSSAFRRMCAHSAISHIPLSRIRRNLKRH